MVLKCFCVIFFINSKCNLFNKELGIALDCVMVFHFICLKKSTLEFYEPCLNKGHPNNSLIITSII